MLPADCLLRGPAAGFPPGETSLTRAERSSRESAPPTGMTLRIVRQRSGEIWRETASDEVAWVLLQGAAELEFAGARATVLRGSPFEEAPTTLHVGPDTPIVVHSTVDSEWAVVSTANEQRFAPRLFRPDELKPEYRGAGLVQNACLRNVRLIFDRSTRPESNLVLGEVVNYPGRWSSYPPHHHDQPEIYHYRFTAPHGYGHAELGDEVLKIRHGDTVIIPPGRDHAQVSAPGYGMYYLWMIRHLPGNPYTGFTFADEHKWTLDPKQQGWRPSDPPQGLT